MKERFKRISLLPIVAIIMLALLQFPVKAVESSTKIVKTTDEFLIYNQNLLQESFKFAFTDEKDIEENKLNYINSIEDSEKNNIAYVNEEIYNSYFLNKNEVYMWAKRGEEVIVKAEKISLDKAITQENINYASNTTKRISTKISEEMEEEIVEGVKKTTTVGVLNIIPEEGYTYEYTIINPQESEEYIEFLALSKEIAKLKENTNSYENILKLNNFYELYNKLIPEKLTKVEDNKIKQPETSKNGEEYIIWLKATNQNGEEITDVQFMTCVREENKEYVPEVIEEKKVVKLPVTFDFNIVLWIIFAIVVLAIIVLLVIRKKISNKDEK